MASTAQTLVNASEILKNYYLPVWKNQINVEPSPFLEKIRKTNLISSTKIIGGAPVGLNGGFAFGTETGATPDPGAQRYEGFEIAPIAMYVSIEISDMAIKFGGSEGSLVSLLDGEIRGSYETAKWNLARALFGNGVGKLATFSGTLSSATTITISNVANVKTGLMIDVYDGTTGSAVASGIRISDVDIANSAIIVDTAVTSSHAGFITCQKSYNHELTGLGAIYDDNITSLYGVTKSSNLWIKPSVIDASHLLTDDTLYDAVIAAKRKSGVDLDMALMGNDAFKAYRNYMNETNMKIVEKRNYIGGATGFTVLVGNRSIDVVNEEHVPTGETWAVDTTTFKLETNELSYMNEEGGSNFVKVVGYPKYRAELSQYGNLMCDKPGGCVQITNCAESA